MPYADSGALAWACRPPVTVRMRGCSTPTRTSSPFQAGTPFLTPRSAHLGRRD